MQFGGPAFTFATTNIAPGSPGTVVTFGNSNADSTQTTLLTALAYDAHLLVVSFGGTNLAEENNALADILIDRAGGTSWSAFIDDLVAGFASPLSSSGAVQNCTYAFPIWIPAGASLGFQGRRAGATADPSGATVHISVFGRPTNPEMWWCGQGVESLGINAGTSQGTTVAPSASSNTYGSWTTIGTSTRRYGSLSFGVNGPNATSVTSGRAQNFQIGEGSSQLLGTPTFKTAYSVGGGTAIMRRQGFDPMMVDIAAGTTLQARAKDSGAAAGSFNMALYGVY